MTNRFALPTLVAICSIALGKPSLSSLAVLREISISGIMLKGGDLANTLQVCLDSGANLFYVAPDNLYKIGEHVIVPKENGSRSSAIILSITSAPPASAENIQEIIGRDDA